MTAVDEVVAAIDARGFQTWNIYRGGATQTDADGVERHVWIAEVSDGQQRLNHHDLSLHQALVWASEVQLLPLVPRRLPVNPREVAKGDREWKVWLPGGVLDRSFKTKRAADEYADAVQRAEVLGDLEWREAWGELVETGTEGVDFRWKR